MPDSKPVTLAQNIDAPKAELKQRILPVRMMIFDVDGVLTDGRVIYMDDGSEIREFDVQDGHGIKLLQRAGIEVALISGRTSSTKGRPLEASSKRALSPRRGLLLEVLH